jgi:hypothetical protein
MKIFRNVLVRPVYRTEVPVYVPYENIYMFIYSCCLKHNYAVNSIQPNGSELNRKIRYIKVLCLTIYGVHILIVINTTGWIRIKMSFGQLVWRRKLVLPSCGVKYRAEVYILKTRMKDKKLEVKCYSGFIWLK